MKYGDVLKVEKKEHKKIIGDCKERIEIARGYHFRIKKGGYK